MLKANWTHRLRLPGSKSVTNRALVLAALAEGESLLQSGLVAEDPQWIREALKEMGISIEDTPEGWKIQGRGGVFSTPRHPLYFGNAGAGIRFFLGVTALLTEPVTLTGNLRLQERPLGDLLEALQELGVYCSEKQTAPVTIRGPLEGGSARISGKISSQYLSALLMVAPYARRKVELTLKEELVSWPYVELTLALMKEFGIAVEVKENRIFRIPQGKYQGRIFEVEADCSSASYFLGAAALTQGRLTIENWNAESKQGDHRILEFLEEMGCCIEESSSEVTVTGPSQLKALRRDLQDQPDLVPTLAILAANAQGRSLLDGIEHLRVKECDRLNALEQELKKCGIPVKAGASSLEIEGKPKDQWQSPHIHCYQDHRIAMSFALARLLSPQLQLDDPRCVEKSFPQFWEYWLPLEEKIQQFSKK
jgi:3-phosphoshikimate 1-carboxyvinyltransferase